MTMKNEMKKSADIYDKNTKTRDRRMNINKSEAEKERTRYEKENNDKQSHQEKKRGIYSMIMASIIAPWLLYAC